MRYRSTRSRRHTVTFQEAVFEGMAPDGGLFVPEILPTLSKEQLNSFHASSVAEIGATILSLFIDDIQRDELEAIVNDALTFPLPIQKIGDTRILELFHGPTLAFKDVAAQILPRLMESYLGKSNRKTLVLTATSGDTGGAVAKGFSEKSNITVAILFPKGKVSKLQRRQLTYVGTNICPIEVEGTFDDCQKILKQAFTDPDLHKYNLTSANSINIGRLIPQMIYYAYAWAQLKKPDLTFVVPSGNMGNITAGLYSKLIGIPIGKIVIACNTNDPVVRYYETGTFKEQEAHQTLSTAMDIGNPSNFERILDALDMSHDTFRDLFVAVRVDDTETIKTIQDIYRIHSYLIDPHTAVAWSASEKLKLKSPIIISTADPMKFAEELQRSTGIHLPAGAKTASSGKSTVYPSTNRYSHVKQIIVSFLNQ